MADNITKVKMKALDRDNFSQEFTLEHAQAILEVKHPMKTWSLDDSNFTMKEGKIVPVYDTE